MAEFVNLNDVNDTLNIIPYNSTALELITPDSIILDGQITSLDVVDYPTDPEVFDIDLIVPTSDTEPTIEPICADDCDVSTYYGEINTDGSFKRINLFSELIDEYERAIARKNLGIADEYSLVWGYISGNILHQKDLYDFVINTNASNINELIEELNLKLAQWGYDIQTSLNNKAPINSPSFTGTPTAPTPSYNDSSTRVPTTEWVTNKISELGIGSLNWLTLNTESIYLGETLPELIVAWDYNEAITSQEINGVILDINARTYTFLNVNSNKSITLKYEIEGISFQKTVLFEVVTPIYYGTQLNHQLNTKTKNSTFILTCGNSDYGYVYVPSNGSARIAVDNIVGGFKVVGTILLNTITYYIYKTVNAGLGNLNINIL